MGFAEYLSPWRSWGCYSCEGGTAFIFLKPSEKGVWMPPSVPGGVWPRQRRNGEVLQGCDLSHGLTSLNLSHVSWALNSLFGVFFFF